MSVATLISDSKPKTKASTQKPEGTSDLAFPGTTNDPIRIRWIDSVDELESIQVEWDDLANHSIRRNPNFESNFLIPAIKYLADDSVRVLVAEIPTADGTRLGALIPLASRKVFGLPFSALEIWKHEQSFDSTPLIRADEANQDLSGHIWSQIIGFLQKEKIAFLSMESVSGELEFESLVDRTETLLGLTIFRKNKFERAAIRLAGTAEEYKKNHFSKNLRKSTRRQLRKLESIGEIQFEKSNPDSDFQSLANEFLAVESSGWKGQNGSSLASNAASRKFYKELITRSVADNKARFLVMRVNGKAVSILSDLQSGNSVFAYKTAFDENFAEFSPGIQAEIENINNLFDDGIEFADSCTASDNSAINRIWGEKEKFQNLVIALKPGIPSLLTRWMPSLQKLVQKFRRQ